MIVSLAGSVISTSGALSGCASDSVVEGWCRDYKRDKFTRECRTSLRCKLSYSGGSCSWLLWNFLEDTNLSFVSLSWHGGDWSLHHFLQWRSIGSHPCYWAWRIIFDYVRRIWFSVLQKKFRISCWWKGWRWYADEREVTSLSEEKPSSSIRHLLWIF